MGLIQELFGMGRKNQKHKKKKTSQYEDQNWNRSDNSHRKLVLVEDTHKGNYHPKISRIENVNKVAETVFGAKYFCVGDHNGMERSGRV